MEVLLKLHPALFRVHFPPRFINSLYFDSVDFHHFMENREGDAYRVKARVRWYGAMMGPIEKSALELKSKSGYAMGKERHEFGPFQFDRGFTRGTIDEALKLTELPDRVRFDLRRLIPTLLTRYDRRYYLSSCGRFRITIDSGLMYIGVNPATNRFLKMERDRESLIVELKYGIDDEEDASEIAEGLPFRLSRSSKYVNGIQRIYAF